VRAGYAFSTAVLHLASTRRAEAATLVQVSDRQSKLIERDGQPQRRRLLDGQQLAQMLAQQRPAELVLSHPGRSDRGLGRNVTGAVAVGQGRVLTAAHGGREQQDRDQEDGVGPGDGEPGPDQARASVCKGGQDPPLLTATTWAKSESCPLAGRSQPGRGRFAVAATPIGGRAVTDLG
jgi:hypothetical protein